MAQSCIPVFCGRSRGHVRDEFGSSDGSSVVFLRVAALAVPVFVYRARVYARSIGVPYGTAFGATSVITPSHTLRVDSPFCVKPHLDDFLMRAIKKIFSWLGAWFGRSVVEAEVMPDDQNQGYQTHAQQAHDTGQPDSGHSEQRSFLCRQVGINEVIPETMESWDRFGNEMRGETVKLKVVTASHRLTTSDQLKCICSACGKAEDTVIESSISQRTLCRICARSFTLPNGQTIHVTPEEHAMLNWNQDTWAVFDHNQERRQQ